MTMQRARASSWPAARARGFIRSRMGVSKQLLPVYDKPMIYYPLSVLMLGGIREIAIITTPRIRRSSSALLGDGSQWGLSLTYIVQPSPDGLAQAYIWPRFPGWRAFGHGAGRQHLFRPRPARTAGRSRCARQGGTVFGYRVADPERYGVVDFDRGRVRAIIEKPAVPPSNFAVTGLYFLTARAPDLAARRAPLGAGRAGDRDAAGNVPAPRAACGGTMGRGYAWLDTGTHGSLLDAGNFRAHAGRTAGPAGRQPRRDRLLHHLMACHAKG
jgi:glucose-1-phosphate thymidylyltransferase